MMRRTRSVWFVGLASSSALLLAACGGGGGGGSSDAGNEDTASAGTYETESVSYESEEDSNPSVSFFTSDDGGLGIRANGVDSGDGDVTKPEVTNVTIEENDTTGASTSGAMVAGAEIASECTDLETGEAGSGDSFDIGVSLDTTSSMQGAAGVLANVVADFATTLEDEGLDVRFTGITLGDAYATKDADTESEFDDAVSTGTLGAVPNFGIEHERPDTGTALLNAGPMETFFSKVSEVVSPNGLGGFDIPENYLGPVEFLHEQVAWRTDAGRFIIGIGDEYAHTPTTFEDFMSEDGGFATWEPPVPEDLAKKLSTEGTAFHWVGDEQLSVGADYYDMAELAAATGGVFTELGDCTSEESCEVDLTELPAVEAVTSARTTRSCTVDIPSGIDRVTTRFDLAAGERSWDVTAVHSIDR